MSQPLADDEPPLDPAAASIVAKVRWLMLISGATTLIAVSVVLGVIGYRFFRLGESSAPVSELTARLPKDARIVSVTASSVRLVVTLETPAGPEILTFDTKTLKPLGRLRFVPER
ncbi:MAG TPA: hypothetical protein VFB45_23980 [Pseudolabrys sp.]|nr:hypothetical protein [Pseudolabrys sp.]